jgi:hypothetical protein
MIQKSPELDLGVAQHIGVGRAACAVLREEALENARAVLLGKVHRFEFDPEYIGHARCIEPVLTARAVALVIVVLPVLHEETNDWVTKLLQ